MTYLEYLNHFNLWLETNALPGNAQLMYFKLLNIFNRAGWPESVQVDNLRLMLMLDGASKTTVIRARDKLVEAGFITFRKGCKGKPNRYGLGKIQYQNDTKSATISDTKSATISDTTNDTHIKTKTKKKTSPPIPPEGEQDGFSRFWSVYPRRIAKGAARKAWDKLNPGRQLADSILAAVERDKATDQWQRDGGQYIPYPATWLNQRRWEDEPGYAEPVQPEPEYRYPTPDDDKPLEFTDGMDWSDLI